MKKIYRLSGFAALLFCFLQTTAQTPIPEDALQLWLRGDDGIAKDGDNKVSAWADQSPAGRLVNQPIPTSQPLWVDHVINGHAVVRFATGVSDFLSTNYRGPNSTEVTIFVVAQGSNISSVVRFQNVEPPSSGYLIYGYTFRGASNGFCMSNDGGDFNGIDCGFFNNSALQIGTARWKANTTNGMQTFINGALLAQRTSSASTLPNDFLQIGTGGAVDESTVGDIAEIIIYDRALTDVERIQVETYLNIKYRVTNNLASSKPGSGNAISFDGSDKSVSIPNSAATNFGVNDFSVAFWYNSANNGRGEIIFEKRDDNCGDGQTWEIRKSADEVYLEINVPGPTSDVVIIPNAGDSQWHHLVFTRNSTQLSGFKDGMLVATATAPAQNVNNSAPLQIGTGPCSPFFPGGNGFFKGSLDEIQLWNTALTQTQIRDRMCHKITSSDPLYNNLVAYYNFDESTGSTVFDGTTNANNGTLVNNPARVTSGAAIGNASSHDYANAVKTTSIIHPTGESFTVTSSSGSTDGIHVYRVDEQPNTMNGAAGVGSNNKYFGVFQVNGTAPQYTAVYNYSGNPFVTAGTESQLQLNKRANNAAASWALIAASPDETNNTITVTGESTEYILGRLGNALPVRVLSFYGIIKNKAIGLQWKVTGEINTAFYEVEHSSNGIAFERTGTVTSKNSTGIHDYTIDDSNPVKGENFYRLKQADKNGRFTYSDIIHVFMPGNGNAMNVYPNPASQFVQLDYTNQHIFAVRVYDIVGRQVITTSMINQQSLKINTEKLAPGKYVVQLNDGKVTATGSFIKQ